MKDRANDWLPALFLVGGLGNPALPAGTQVEKALLNPPPPAARQLPAGAPQTPQDVQMELGNHRTVPAPGVLSIMPVYDYIDGDPVVPTVPDNERFDFTPDDHGTYVSLRQPYASKDPANDGYLQLDVVPEGSEPVDSVDVEIGIGRPGRHHVTYRFRATPKANLDENWQITPQGEGPTPDTEYLDPAQTTARYDVPVYRQQKDAIHYVEVVVPMGTLRTEMLRNEAAPTSVTVFTRQRTKVLQTTYRIIPRNPQAATGLRDASRPTVIQRVVQFFFPTVEGQGASSSSTQAPSAATGSLSNAQVLDLAREAVYGKTEEDRRAARETFRIVSAARPAAMHYLLITYGEVDKDSVSGQRARTAIQRASQDQWRDITEALTSPNDLMHMMEVGVEAVEASMAVVQDPRTPPDKQLLFLIALRDMPASVRYHYRWMAQDKDFMRTLSEIAGGSTEGVAAELQNNISAEVAMAKLKKITFGVLAIATLATLILGLFPRVFRRNAHRIPMLGGLLFLLQLHAAGLSVADLRAQQATPPAPAQQPAGTTQLPQQVQEINTMDLTPKEGTGGMVLVGKLSPEFLFNGAPGDLALQVTAPDGLENFSIRLNQQAAQITLNKGGSFRNVLGVPGMPSLPLMAHMHGLKTEKENGRQTVTVSLSLPFTEAALAGSELVLEVESNVRAKGVLTVKKTLTAATVAAQPDMEAILNRAERPSTADDLLAGIAARPLPVRPKTPVAKRPKASMGSPASPGFLMWLLSFLPRFRRRPSSSIATFLAPDASSGSERMTAQQALARYLLDVINAKAPGTDSVDFQVWINEILEDPRTQDRAYSRALLTEPHLLDQFLIAYNDVQSYLRKKQGVTIKDGDNYWSAALTVASRPQGGKMLGLDRPAQLLFDYLIDVLNGEMPNIGTTDMLDWQLALTDHNDTSHPYAAVMLADPPLLYNVIGRFDETDAHVRLHRGFLDVPLSSAYISTMLATLVDEHDSKAAEVGPAPGKQGLWRENGFKLSELLFVFSGISTVLAFVALVFARLAAYQEHKLMLQAMYDHVHALLPNLYLSVTPLQITLTALFAIPAAYGINYYLKLDSERRLKAKPASMADQVKVNWAA